MDVTPFKDLYPFDSHWLDQGPGERDAPAMGLVHGNPTWSFYYRTPILAVSRTHRVVVPDHGGLRPLRQAAGTMPTR